jgi:5-methylcytosine-specific restriction endonuclease McrA
VARVVAWQRANPEKVYEKQRRWRLSNSEKHRANVARRKAMKLAQRCLCCTNADIQNVYAVAALCGADSHVDHKVALRLGGLHCVKNLQPLTMSAHVEKTKQDNRLIADVRLRSKLLQNWRIAA